MGSPKSEPRGHLNAFPQARELQPEEQGARGGGVPHAQGGQGEEGAAPAQVHAGEYIFSEHGHVVRLGPHDWRLFGDRALHYIFVAVLLVAAVVRRELGPLVSSFYCRQYQRRRAVHEHVDDVEAAAAYAEHGACQELLRPLYLLIQSVMSPKASYR